MNSIPVKGSQAMGCTKENKLCVFQLLMDAQSAGPKAGAGVKQTPTETKSVLNLRCEHQDYPTYSFNTLIMLQCFREGHGTEWISESPPEEPFFLLWRETNKPAEATNSNTGDLLK